MKPVRVTGVVVLCQSIQVCILCAFCVCVVYYVQHVCVYVCVASSSGSPIFSAGERGREEEKERGGGRERERERKREREGREGGREYVSIDYW